MKKPFESRIATFTGLWFGFGFGFGFGSRGAEVVAERCRWCGRIGV